MTNSSTPSDLEFSLFLLPCKEHDQLLRLIAQECSSVVLSKPFIPHLTVYFGSGSPQTEQVELTETIGRSFAPITQKIVGYTAEDRFWRAGYLALSGGAKTDAIDHLIRASISTYGTYSFFPHVSLVYAHSISSSDQERLSQIAKSRLDSAGLKDLVFDRVALIRRSSSDLPWEDVNSWRVIRESPLRGQE
jgi:hypothetical protein